MNIRERSDILEIFDDLADLRFVVSHLNNRLRRSEECLNGTYAELALALGSVSTAVTAVETIIERLADGAGRAGERSEFSDDEAKRLQHLNKIMNVIGGFILQSSEVIGSSMEAKLADDSDPLCDFEIEAKIDYRLREDDPDYDKNGDNYLSSRYEPLKRDGGSPKILGDWRYGQTPEPFRSEPLSWLLHSLIEHNGGPNAPRISPRDCLRIGTVFLDIQVWWQYAFDVDSGKWLKQSRQPGGMSEFAKTPCKIHDSDR